MRLAHNILTIAGVALVAAPLSSAGQKKASPVTVVTGVSPGPVTMETVNASWTGVRCQIRFSPEIKKDTNKAGWSQSEWVQAPTLPGDRDLYVRLWVSDRAALNRGGYLRRQKFIRPGTPFIAIGWTFQEPAKQKTLVLGLRFEQTSVQARLEFRDTKAIDLEDIERVAKVELFQMLGRSDPLPSPPPPQVRTPVVTPSLSATPPSPPENPSGEIGPRTSGTDAVYRPEVEIIAASAKPARVSPGSQITLMLLYQVKGLPPGASFEVVERRILKRDSVVLATFEEALPRASGNYTSTQQIDVAAGMGAGIYTFEGELTLAGVTARSSALFEIQ